MSFPLPPVHDFVFREGRRGRPCVVLIHGLGMNADFWFRPSRLSVMGGLAPLEWFLAGGERHCDPSPVFAEALAGAGFHLASWSQERPVGPLDAAARELDLVAEAVRRRLGDAPLILAGHSRGGLIARRWIGAGRQEVRGLVTLGTPHGGSSLASWVELLAPLGTVLDRLRARVRSSGAAEGAVDRLIRFLTSPGVRELEPGSPLIEDINLTPLARDIFALTVAGTDPGLLALPLSVGTDPLVFPPALARLFPGSLVPEEWQRGKGDGLVSVRSAGLEGVERHDVPLNHVTLAFDPDLAQGITSILGAV